MNFLISMNLNFIFSSYSVDYIAANIYFLNISNFMYKPL